MKKIIIKKVRQYRSYIILFVVVMLVEVFFFNISAWRSIGNTSTVLRPEQITVTGADKDETSGIYTVTDDTIEIDMPYINQNVSSVDFGIVFTDEIVPYIIKISDDGNAAEEYSLPMQYILQWDDSSRYITIHSYGKIHSMRLTCNADVDSTFQIVNITMNPKRQVHIKWLRVFGCYFILCLLALFRKKSRIHRIPFASLQTDGNSTVKQESFKKLFMTIFIVVGIACVCFMNLKLGEIWKTNDQSTGYQELAHSLAEGHFYLDEEPSKELIEMYNPYDQTQRVADGVGYRWDIAYYNGHYYNYFGVVPVLFTYLPYYLLTGNDLPNVYAGLFFSLIMFLSAVWLSYEFVKKFFNRAPFYLWPVFIVLIGFSFNLVYLYQRPDMYDVPIMAANTFTMLGFASWMYALRQEEKKEQHELQAQWYAIGSICMALVAGCRPQMLLGSVLAIPLFWESIFKKRTLLSRKSVGRTVALLAPYVLIGLGIMYYNTARFGSPFDFGAAYNLTTNDMTKRGFTVDRLGAGLVTFLLQPPYLIATFPFVQAVTVSTEYMGKSIIETLYGGFIPTNLVVIFCFAYGYVRKRLREKRLANIILLSMIVAVLICCLDATMAGILQRYTADFALFLLLPGCLIAGTILEHFWNKKSEMYYVLSMLLCVIMILLLLFDFAIICLQLGDSGIYTERSTTFYQLRSYFVLQ